MVMIGGLSQIIHHAESKVHITKCKENNAETNKENKDANMVDESLSFEEQKVSAEIKFAALIAEKNISLQNAQDILKFFQDVGKNFNVLKNMSMGRSKCTNIISNVLCPVETYRVVNIIQNTRFSIFIDETSDISNKKWMTFLVRYVDPKTLNVHSQLLKLINIDATKSSAEKLFHAFQCEMWKFEIPFQNIIALSCDNASVMVGKNTSFKTMLQKVCKNALTLTCPCHSAALAAHFAYIKIPTYCDDLKKKIASYINSSPKRSAIYEEFNESFQKNSHKILKLSTTRWLSHCNGVAYGERAAARPSSYRGCGARWRHRPGG